MSAPASHAIPQGVCRSPAQGNTKAASHAANYNVTHAPGVVADLVPCANLFLLHGVSLLGGSSGGWPSCTSTPLGYVPAIVQSLAVLVMPISIR